MNKTSFLSLTRTVIISSMLFFLIASCGRDSNSSNMLYTSGGRTSEVLVVIGDELWKSPIGDSIQSILGVIPEWMARVEPEYDITHITYSTFGATFQKQRNILYIKLEDIPNAKVELLENVYARPQAVISIKAKDVDGIVEAFVKYQNRIKSTFHKNELKRIGDAYKGLEVRELSKNIKEQFGFSMVLPKGFYLANSKADFAWLRRQSDDVEEGIFIYTTPYTDIKNFDLQNIINLRDSITYKYLPGPVDNSYMKVSSFFPPYYQRTKFKGHYAAQLRSLWDIEGYPMGGPFMSYTFVDSLAYRLITIDGYIKAPKKEKRDLMLHVEAIMESFHYTEQGTDSL